MSALCSCAELKAVPRPQLDFALPADNPHYNIHTRRALFILYKIKNLRLHSSWAATKPHETISPGGVLLQHESLSKVAETQTIKKVKTNPSTHTWVYRNPHAILNLATVLGER